MQQIETTYNSNSHSNSHVILVTAKQRFHDETGTGALGTASTGVKARVTYAASYFDGADRLTGVVDVGTNGGSSYTRPSTVPSRSDTVLVTTTAYNSAGLAWKRIDPRGIETRSYFNALGDVTKSIENYVDGVVSDTDDKTTESTYNAAGLKTVKVVLPSSGQQVTEWVYGVTTSGGSGLNSNDLVKEVRYPDPSTGASSSSSKDVLTVNALGQPLTMTDRNGTVHTYSYDVLGRQTADAVTTLGSGVDGTVRRLVTAYDTQGSPYLFTAYDASSGGSIVNQVKQDFNGLGQVTSEWQSHSGAVTGTSPRVQYAYSEMAGGVNHSRLTSVTYASGYAVNYNYASGLDANISRLSSLSDSSNTLEAYSYLGLGTVVKRAHSQPGVDLSYIKLSTESVGDAGDQYTGLDRFGRVVDQRWINGSGTDVDRYQYGYDRDGNRLYKDNKVFSSLSEVYTYDSLNQIATYKLGTLNSGKTDVTGAPSNSHSWDYDAVGNWDSVTTNSTTQTRSANKQNEITSVSGATTPTYDSNGNLTTDENNYRFVYDAWNRVVQVKNSSNVVIVTYGRDALHRHVTDTVGSTVTDRFFSSDWQVLETKTGSNTVTRNVWSPVYVDALVLRDRDTDGNGSLDERLYALQDANWNTTALINSSGTTQERYTYTPFGQVTFRDGSGSTLSASAKDWVFLHQGGERIAAGDYEFRNRVYSPSLGRWLSNDPLGFKAGDVNFYRYVRNQPTGYLDYSGLEINAPIKNPANLKFPKFKYGDQIITISVGTDETIYNSQGNPVKGINQWIAINVGSDTELPPTANWMQIIKYSRFKLDYDGRKINNPGWFGTGGLGKRDIYVPLMGEWYADTAMPDDGKSYPFFPIPGNSSRTDKNFTIVDLPEIKSKPGDEKIHGHEQIWEAHTFLIIDEKPVYDVHWQRTGTYNQKMKKFDIKYSILETTKPVDNVFYFDPLGDDTIRSGYKNGSGPNENPVPDPVTPILYPNPINKKYRK